MILGTRYLVGCLALLTACGPSKAERCAKIHSDATISELANAGARRTGQPEKYAPPTPKEMAWYEENCWQGKPR